MSVDKAREALKPCPFCGQSCFNEFTANVFLSDTVLTKSKVRCQKCGSETDLAIWNTRAYLQEPSGWREVKDAIREARTIITFLEKLHERMTENARHLKRAVDFLDAAEKQMSPPPGSAQQQEKGWTEKELLSKVLSNFERISEVPAPAAFTSSASITIRALAASGVIKLREG